MYIYIRITPSGTGRDINTDNQNEIIMYFFHKCNAARSTLCTLTNSSLTLQVTLTPDQPEGVKRTMRIFYSQCYPHTSGFVVAGGDKLDADQEEDLADILECGQLGHPPTCNHCCDFLYLNMSSQCNYIHIRLGYNAKTNRKESEK